ncbi:MAG: hypothetical protein Q7J08_05185 [Methanocorpusculum sp.]|uniref:hypothetical protein n=1 Tax=Methanocorpusculum sp. TaxID=2058474 RepID=UPI00271D9575|nr:hypothetical protein [Methanocorpusculum sp.]MDO9523092.1 hypothetical protein [Methanocorpusculum sp.]
MKKILIAAVLAVLLVSVGAAGCIGSEPIVGDWLVSGTEIPVVFHDDGTGTLTLYLFGVISTVPLAWEKVEEKTYKITGTSALFNAGTYTVSADGKSLVEVSTGLTVFVKKA